MEANTRAELRRRSESRLRARGSGATRSVAPSEASEPIDAYAAYLAWLRIEGQLARDWGA